MKEFLYLFRGGDAVQQTMSPEEMERHMHQWRAWIQALAKAGTFKSGQPLDGTGKVLSGRGKLLTDGPFVESKEIVGGYLIVSAKDLDAAAEMAKGCPIFQTGGSVEVRPINEMTV